MLAVRDSKFGVGFFREIPFLPYAPEDQLVFNNLQDVTDDLDLLQDAVDELDTDGNID